VLSAVVRQQCLVAVVIEKERRGFQPRVVVWRMFSSRRTSQMICGRYLVLVSEEAPKGGVSDVSHKHNPLRRKNEERQRVVFELELPDGP
jgi:hypothetical protein